MQVLWPNKTESPMLDLHMPQDRKRRRSELTAHARTALTWTPEGRRKREHPRTTWRRTVMEEMRSAGIGWESVIRISQDRSDLEGTR